LRAVIFANGQLGQPFSPLPDDLIIAADGGAIHCKALEITPKVIIGDLDSLNKGDLESFQAGGAEIIQFPNRKDYTDLELALQYVDDLGIEDVLILAALGERWDQTFANIHLPIAYSSMKISMIDNNQEIFFLHKGQLEILGQPNDIVSLIPLMGDVEGVTTQGLEYPINNDTLSSGSTRGISNVLLGDHATIVIKEGLLLCTIIHNTI